MWDDTTDYTTTAVVVEIHEALARRADEARRTAEYVNREAARRFPQKRGDYSLDIATQRENYYLPYKIAARVAKKELDRFTRDRADAHSAAIREERATICLEAGDVDRQVLLEFIESLDFRQAELEKTFREMRKHHPDVNSSNYREYAPALWGYARQSRELYDTFYDEHSISFVEQFCVWRPYYAIRKAFNYERASIDADLRIARVAREQAARRKRNRRGENSGERTTSDA